MHEIGRINRVIHEPARMAIIALLYVVDSADFIFIQNQTQLTWGNLSAHISKLESAGYVEVEKSFRDKRPNTMLRLTTEGRAAFLEYRNRLQKVLNEMPG